MPKEKIGPPRRGMGKQSGEASRLRRENLRHLPWIIVGFALLTLAAITMGVYGSHVESVHAATATAQAMEYCQVINNLNYLNPRPVPTPLGCS